MKQITVDQFLKIMPQLTDSDILVDVRETSEFEERRVAGSISVPLVDIGKHLDKLRQYQNIYLICESGGRSYYASEILASIGIEATNIIGGIMSINNSDLVLEASK